MIEINLVPDVKQEYIKANRVRTLVISSAVLVGIVAVGLVVLLAIYLFLGQTVRSNLADAAIKDKSNQLQNVADLGNTLTIQHQLSKVTELHNGKNISSRFFELLVAINPAAPNEVSFSLARMDAETKTIRLEGQAVNGYLAADVLKKTILGTTLSYQDENGQTKTVPLTTNVSTAELSFGEDSTGKKVLRFTLSFVYDDAFFARSSKNAIIVRPDRQNATDSFLHLPESLFSERATDQNGGNQ
jgi:hypothetical protein